MMPGLRKHLYGDFLECYTINRHTCLQPVHLFIQRWISSGITFLFNRIKSFIIRNPPKSVALHGINRFIIVLCYVLWLSVS